MQFLIENASTTLEQLHQLQNLVISSGTLIGELALLILMIYIFAIIFVFALMAGSYGFFYVISSTFQLTWGNLFRSHRD